MLLNLDRARGLMEEAEIDVLIGATPVNVIYMSDFASEFLLGKFDDHVAAAILPRSTEIAPVLVIPEFDLPYAVARPSWIETLRSYGNPWSSVGVYMEEALVAGKTDLKRRLATLRGQVAPTQRENFQDALEAALGEMGLADARIGIDDPRLATRLAASGIGSNRIADTAALMRRIRMVKTEPELAILTRGAEINAEALRNVVAAGAAGGREDELIRVYRRTLTERDARYLGERGMMFGPGEASAFSLPASSERRLQQGDAVVLDCLGTWCGYHMDLARTAVVGAPNNDQETRYRAVATALDEIEAAMLPGVHTADLRHLARKTIEGFGLRGDLASITTHGLGLEIFEFPTADSLAKGFALEAGMVVNTEVFFRDPELGAFHLEDSVCVTSGGVQFLHAVPRELVVFD